jgi:hypothetical protein
MRQRGERIERSFAHLYDTGGMRRTHLRGHENILKRLLIHAGGFNLGLLIRSILGVGHTARPPGPTRGRPRRRFDAHRRRTPPIHRDPRRATRDRGHERLGHVTDHTRCQLVSGGDLYHGQLGSSTCARHGRKIAAAFLARQGRGGGFACGSTNCFATVFFEIRST